MMPSSKLETIPALFAHTRANCGDAMAVLVPHSDQSIESVTWTEFARDVARLADALVAMGVSAGDRVVHVSSNRYEWIVTDIALHSTRAVHVPVHGTHSGAQIAAQFEHSGAILAIVESKAVWEKFAPLVERPFPAIVYDLEEDAVVGDANMVSYRNVTDRASATAGLQRAQAASHLTTPDELATILYTSGTTGEPKGVMLSQRNLATNCIATSKVINAAAHEIRLNVLPLSHIYARLCDLYTWLFSGAQIAVARSRDTAIGDCQLVRPHILNGVPYFYEKMIQHLVETGEDDAPGALSRLLGGRIRLCICGGAALPLPIAKFFEKQHVTLIPGYGLTESSPVISAARSADYVVGTVGPPIDGVEVRIADDGEVLTRGPHVMMGYYRDDEATKAAIKNGWLHTGDFGAIDDIGNLIIRGRKKEIIVLATGKNVTPTYVEGLLTSSPLIDQAIVLGDDRKFIAALIHPDADRLATEARRRQIELPPPEEWASNCMVRDFFEQEIADRVATASHWEQVKAFTLLDQPFTIDAGELTPKLSLRRSVILSRYRDTIEAMYLQAERR